MLVDDIRPAIDELFADLRIPPQIRSDLPEGWDLFSQSHASAEICKEPRFASWEACCRYQRSSMIASSVLVTLWWSISKNDLRYDGSSIQAKWVDSDADHRVDLRCQ